MGCNMKKNVIVRNTIRFWCEHCVQCRIEFYHQAFRTYEDSCSVERTFNCRQWISKEVISEWAKIVRLPNLTRAKIVLSAKAEVTYS